MPMDSHEYHSQLLAVKAVGEQRSPLLVSSVETFNAALWVIAGGCLSQAVSLMHTAIELALKSELDRVHRILIADRRGLEYSDLKKILRDEFGAHPRGRNILIPPFEIDKTILFMEAVDRIVDLYREAVGPWHKRLKTLHDLRNDIVHFGQKQAAQLTYVEAITTIAIPFYDEFLKEVLPQGISPENLIMPTIYREALIAANVAKHHKTITGTDISSSVLSTVGAALRYNASHVPVFVDRDGTIEDEGERDFLLLQQAKREVEKAGFDVDHQTNCRICRSFGSLVSFDVSDEEDSPTVFVRYLACFNCGMTLKGEGVDDLANLHYGPIGESEQKAFLKAIGRSP